ncbi:MAG: dihydroorotase [Clostridiales bacterium]|nr:dihydroorotase [Clostridiales bacterium]
MSLCIRNGNIIDGEGIVFHNKDILIKNNLIVDINTNLAHKADRIIDASNLWVLPGLIDAHCHLREPGFEYKEDISSGTASAAAGGFTSIACMPNTLPAIDNAAMVEYIKKKAATQGIVRVYPIGAITLGREGKTMVEMGEMKEAGAVALSDDGDPVVDPNTMRLALEYAKQFGLLLISHCEDKSLVAQGVMNEGYMSTLLGLKGISRAAEEVMVARDIILSEITACPIHIAHVSTKGAVDIIRQAKSRGVPVTCETAPHYFSATDEWVEGYDTNTKVNPPLRTEEDLVAIKEGLKDGTIDIIATDHAPHHRDEKEVEYDMAASGISGFETAFSLSYTHLVETGILSLEELVAKLSSIPAKILGIPGGVLKAGLPADITIVDINREYEVDRDHFYSKGKNTPFHGKRLKGKIAYTIVGGKIVYDEEDAK